MDLAPTIPTVVALLAVGVVAVFLRWWARSPDWTTPRPGVLSMQESFFRIACEDAEDGILLQDLSARILWANPAYARIVERPLSDIIGRNPLEYCMPPELAPTAEEIAAFRYDPTDPLWEELETSLNIRPSGERFWLAMRVGFHELPTGEHLAILVCRDVTKQVETERKLRDLATIDPLTGAINRTGLQEFLESHLAGDRRETAGLGVLQIDLDKFKSVNDTFGHAAGDALLTHVATLLKAQLRTGDRLARLGGDEFVVVCPGMGNVADLERLGQALCAAVREPLLFEGQKLTPAISVGAVMADGAGESIDDLLRKSDFALYDAKRRGRGTAAVYDRDLHDRHRRKEARAAALQRAVRRGEIGFVFQPTLEMRTGRIKGFEGLARWYRPEGGVELPETFLPLADELALTGDIDRQALEAAVGLKARLDAAGYDRIRVGFNASQRFFDRRDATDLLLDLPRRHGVAPEGLVIEIPESVAFAHGGDPRPETDPLAQAQAAGWNVLLDHFGAGFAGLLHLSKLRILGFKIDRQLTATLATLPATRKTIAMVNEMAADLGLYSVTVGIETAEQFAGLQETGGAVGQGSWIAPPASADATLAWLAARTRTTDEGHFLCEELPLQRRIAI